MGIDSNTVLLEMVDPVRTPPGEVKFKLKIGSNQVEKILVLYKRVSIYESQQPKEELLRQVRKSGSRAKGSGRKDERMKLMMATAATGDSLDEDNITEGDSEELLDHLAGNIDDDADQEEILLAVSSMKSVSKTWGKKRKSGKMAKKAAQLMKQMARACTKKGQRLQKDGAKDMLDGLKD